MIGPPLDKFALLWPIQVCYLMDLWLSNRRVPHRALTELLCSCGVVSWEDRIVSAVITISVCQQPVDPHACVLSCSQKLGPKRSALGVAKAVYLALRVRYLRAQVIKRWNRWHAPGRSVPGKSDIVW